MNEIELRFHVPADQLPGVRRWLDARRPAERLPLAAIYFDTAERSLARAGIGLRLRQEGPQWVQTCKGPAEDGITRLEHNAAAGTAEPQLDLSRHAGHPLGERLATLGRLDLRPVFETRIERAQRASRVPGAQLELALDVGELRAGEARLPVHELELELAGGAVNALLAYAHGLMTRLPLSLDLRSKAERGENLARGLRQSPPRKAKPLALRKDMTAAAALRAVLLSAFDQVAANASQIGSGDWTDEHLHQLRVGLRRLKSGLRLFRGLGPTARHPAWPAFEAQATALLKALGPLRDAALQPAQRWPALAQALAELGLSLPEPAPGPARAAEVLALLRAPQPSSSCWSGWAGCTGWTSSRPTPRPGRCAHACAAGVSASSARSRASRRWMPRPVMRCACASSACATAWNWPPASTSPRRWRAGSRPWRRCRNGWASCVIWSWRWPGRWPRRPRTGPGARLAAGAPAGLLALRLPKP
ncbi:MAG: inorganic triphosphatase [Inhella sp.]